MSAMPIPILVVAVIVLLYLLNSIKILANTSVR